MRALVCSGGAVKGAYQVGVLKKWMYEDGLDYDILCGISVGAINTAYISQFKIGTPKTTWEALRSMWSRVSTDKVWKSWFLGKVESLWKPSIYNSQPLIDWITSELDEKAIAESGRKLRIGSVAWDTGEYRVVSEIQPNIAKWVTASASFPVFLLPIDIGGKLWSDGGLRNVTPLGEAIKAGATQIDVIMCSNPDLPSSWPTKGQAAIPDYVLQTLTIMSDEIVRGDLQICGLKNDIAELCDKYKKIEIRVVMPAGPLCGNSLEFDPAEIEKMIGIGYADACNACLPTS